MAYIRPGTTVKVLQNVPLDNTYTNTLYFNSIAEQKAYFDSKVKVTFSENTYQRHSNNSIKVQYRPEDLYDCNYIMFNNAPYGTRWFYAFITDTEYIANNVAIIYYELDVMQTYHFDYQLMDVFVEREHSASDIIGEHTLPENVELGDYITVGEPVNIFNSNLHIYVACSKQYDGDITDSASWEKEYEPAIWGTYPNPFYIYDFGSMTPDAMRRLSMFLKIVQAITPVAGALDIFSVNNIISIYTAPAAFWEEKYVEDSYTITDTFDYNLPARNLSFNGVKNNKLFTYPYCLCVFSGGGVVRELKYELFNATPKIKTFCEALAPNCEVVGVPSQYAGEDDCWAEAITVKGWPLIPWVKDYYQNYLARNVVPTLVGLGTTALLASAVGGLALPGVGASLIGNTFKGGALVKSGLTNTGYNVGLAGSVLIGNTVRQMTQAKIMPDTVNGQVDGSDTLAYHNKKGFQLLCKSIKPEYIKVIDNYFSMYGYATRVVKKPNRNVRAHWTFTKTIGCDVSGDVPTVYKDIICRIYDNGITFWRNPTEVGNYSLTNNPL